MVRNNRSFWIFIIILTFFEVVADIPCECMVPESSQSSGDYSYLEFSTYLGGNSTEFGIYISNMVIDESGSCYVGGYTRSADFPLKNAFDEILNGYEGFITKLNSQGELELSSYWGGNGIDSVDRIALGTDGSIFVTGNTNSTNFPTLNAFNSTLSGNGTSDCYVTKFNPDGTLNYSTYFGGSDRDINRGMGLDSSGSVFICGLTYSADLPLLNPFDTTLQEEEKNSTGFITRFNPDGSLNFSSYIDITQIMDIAVSQDGCCYLTGEPTTATFPVVNAIQSVKPGKVDTCAIKFNPDMSINFSTYLGGDEIDWGNTITIDQSGNCYLAGRTDSTNFPGGVNRGLSDVFITILDSSGNFLRNINFGGEKYDEAYDIVVDEHGYIYVLIQTLSPNLPLINSYKPYCEGDDLGFPGWDGYVAKLHQDGSILYSTYIGGSSSEFTNGIGVDQTGACIISVTTDSLDYPTNNAFDSTRNGYDVAVSKILDPLQDYDGDTMPNLWEYTHGLALNNTYDAFFDADRDGLTNVEEFNLGTNLYDRDSDNDGCMDGRDTYPLSFMYPTGLILIFSSILIIGIGSYWYFTTRLKKSLLLPTG